MTDVHLDIADAPPVLVSETFVSLQGEGTLTGVPSWFCRLSGCNLRCTWCDTPYASWSPEGDTRPVGALVDEAVRSGVRHAVLTGGEPMIFGPLATLCSGLRNAGIHITIETAGTVDRDIDFDLMSISPKLSNSTPVGDARDPDGRWARLHEARRIDTAALQGLLDRARPGTGRARQLKFVVTAGERMDAEVAEIDALLGMLRGVDPAEVMLMPEGVTTPDRERTAPVADLCVRRGWRYCHRLHIDLYGDTRGT